MGRNVLAACLGQEWCKIAISDTLVDIVQTKLSSCRLRLLLQRRTVRLRQIDKIPIIPEIAVPQMREAIEAKPPDDQPIEIAHQIIRQEEAADFGIGDGSKASAACVELITMRMREPDRIMLGEDCIQGAARSAFPIANQNLLELSSALCQYLVNARGNLAWRIVKLGWQALQLCLALAQSQLLAKRNNFCRQGAASKDQAFSAHRRGLSSWSPQLFRPTRARASSALIAASRP